MQIEIFKSKVTGAVFSLACQLHLNNVFNETVSPEENLRCFDFLPPHSELQIMLHTYQLLVITMRVGKFFIHLKSLPF